MKCCRLSALLVFSWALVSLVRADEPAKVKSASSLVAKRLDEALARARDRAAPLPAHADDATFFRRLSIDLTGQVPSAEELRKFLADVSPDKKTKLIERLLASEAYAVNWGRYWRDVLTYHTPASGNYLRWELFDRWLVDQVRQNRPWSGIVTSLVTATGVNDETAPVNFLTSHFGNPIEIAATTSRVFLGVQLQCAQCHDAKSEPWKREQFHELVAFFGRTRIIQHKDVFENGRGTPYAIEGRAEGQYHMPDRKNPEKLITMAPRFLSGDAVAATAPDLERRTALAQFLTSPKNPWFAKAYVNRIWTSLMGWGFYPSVTDLGSDIKPRYPEVLDILAKEFNANGHDMRWLFQTIVSTEAYQRRMQPRPDSDSMNPAAAVCPSRLRPEQVFEALVKALGFKENDKSIPAPAASSAPAVKRHDGLRHMIYQAFKADPSQPPEEIQGTIPQALLLMNSVLVNTYVAATGQTFLADALTKNLTNDQIVVAMYERTLSRRPLPQELETCRSYLGANSNRQEALEDVFWTLINSTEFLTKR